MNNRPREAPAGVSLGDIQQMKPLTFTTMPYQMVDQDWLTNTERKLDIVGCSNVEKVYYATHLLTGWDTE